MRAFLLVCVLLAGCALFPLQEKDCVGVNWEQRGYADGFSGQFQQYLRLAEECARFGVDRLRGGLLPRLERGPQRVGPPDRLDGQAPLMLRVAALSRR